MNLYIHQCILSIKLPASKVRRVCLLALSDKSIILACLGLTASALAVSSGPILRYIIFKWLNRKLASGRDLIEIPYNSIIELNPEVKYGVEILRINTFSGVYEVTALGRYAKFGMSRLLSEIKARAGRI